MQKLSHPLLSFFFVVVVVYLPAWLPFTLPYQICYALRSLSPSPLCFTVFFPYIFRFTFISFSFLALQTISPWRRQSKTWPPCITLVGLWCLAHECTWLPPRLWMFLHHRLFLRLSWHGFYVFFTSSLPPPTSSPPPSWRQLWASLLLKRAIHLCIHLSSLLVLSPLATINNFMLVSSFLLSSPLVFFCSLTQFCLLQSRYGSNKVTRHF